MSAAVLIAAQAAAEGGFDWALWIARVINFVLFVGVIGWFLVPVSRKLLGSRKAEIREELRRSREDLEAARRRSAEAEATLARLEEEVAAVRETARQEAEAERERILEEARRGAERILALAEQQVRSSMREARRELRRYAAEVATDAAAERLRREIGPAEREALFEEAAADLERSAAGGER